MIEINFIEEKKHNVVPYVIAIVFVLLLVLSGLFLSLQYSSHQQTLDSIQQQIDRNIEKQTEFRSLKTVEEQRLSLGEQVDYVQGEIFPTISLLDHMIGLLPQDSYFTNYSFSIVDGLSIEIRAEDMNLIAAYNHALLQQDFVEIVNLSTIDRTASENAYFIANFEIQIDEQSWMEVAGQ